MPVICKCVNGHEFIARIIEDDPETNSMTIDPEQCPECGELAEVFEIEDEEVGDLGEY